jgi:predicted ATP-grasp superfamily ATP-dependent carboligase
VNPTPLTAFVTDGDERPALAVVRSLARQGVSVIVGAEHPTSLASQSRACARHVTYPSPYRHPEQFDRFLLDFVRRERVGVVMPVTEVTTYLVSRNRRVLLPHSAVAAPAFEAFDAVADKTLLIDRASASGVPVPRTQFVDGVTSLRGVLKRIEYPAVVKPFRSRIRVNGGWLHTSVRYARSEAELVALYQTVEYLARYPSMIQERIAGPGTGLFVLCDHGRIRAQFAHRRLREKPPSGGVSVLAESIAADPQLVDQAERLLGPLGWQGVAMLEYKRDARTGRPYLMEVNGRFWGSLQLAIDAGVDFPALAYKLALGCPPGPRPAYRTGVKSRWLLGDLDHLLARLRRTDDRALPEGAPTRAHVVAEFLKFAGRGLRYDVIRLRDPRPFAYELRRYLIDALHGAARSIRSSRNDPREVPTHVDALR